MADSHIATYNIQVFSPKPEEDAPSVNDIEKRVLADLPAKMEAIEEQLTELLPEGYTVKITEWDKMRPSGHLVFGDDD